MKSTLAVLGFWVVAGCGGATVSTSGSTTGGGNTTGAGTTTSTGLGTKPTGTLAISPATNTLQVASGTPSTLQLQAVLVNAQGSTPVAATWTSSVLTVATVGVTSGLVSASGPLGGAVTITAVSNGQTATATVNVVVTQTIFVGGLTPTVVGSFGAAPTASATASPAFLYPADQTIIPVNLDPMNFQWQPGAGNTLFRIGLSGPFAVLVAYLQPTATASGALQPAWQPTAADWQAFAQSNIGQTVGLAVEATTAAGTVVTASAVQKLTLAASRFAGTIYYWNIEGGEILQIDPNGGKPQIVYTPPMQPSAPDAGPTNNTCLACHSISQDGTRLSADTWGGDGPGTIVDLTTTPATALVAPATTIWDFSSFGPTTNLLLTAYNGAFTLRDSSNAAPLPAGSGESNQTAIGCGKGGYCTQPNWARDGKLMTFAQGLAQLPELGDGGPTFFGDWSFNQTDLMVSSFDSTTQTFGTPTLLASHDFDGQELANFYPSFSTDDALVAFTRSSCSYRSDGACPGLSAKDELLVVPVTGGTPVELVQAEGGDERNRYPNFSPFKEGGYHWMTFYSQRDYGWVTRGTGLRQVWVTAVDDTTGAPTADPSHPAFWLPGQDSTTENDRAEWATLPCVSQGSGCQGDIDCCSGLVCRGTDAGVSQCLPAATACGYVGDTCAASGDCCSPFVCTGGTCSVVFQ